jgi:hypothetical protein
VRGEWMRIDGKEKHEAEAIFLMLTGTVEDLSVKER